jgi:hypothetical protein
MLLLAVVVACCTLASVSARATRRHPSLDPLTSHDGALSAAGRQAHSAKFHSALAQYAQHLEHAADTMLLQARALVEEQHDVGADMSADESAQSHHRSGSSSTAGSTMTQHLQKYFADGNAAGVAQVLEQKHGIDLDSEQRHTLNGYIKTTMQMVGAAVDNGERVNFQEVAALLDSQITDVAFPVDMTEHQSMFEHASESGADSESESETEVESEAEGQAASESEAGAEPAPEWFRGILAKAATDIATGNKSSGLMEAVTDAAAAHAEKVDPRVRRYNQPLEVTMGDYLAKAFGDIHNKSSTLGQELAVISKTHVLATDPSLQQAPTWAQMILADTIRAVGDPNRTITKLLSQTAVAVTMQLDPDVQQAPTWAQHILADAIVQAATGEGELATKLKDVAQVVALKTPSNQSTDDLAAEIFNNLHDGEIEAHVRFEARKQVWTDMVTKEKAKCLRKRARGKTCDMKKFVDKIQAGTKDLVANELPDTVGLKKDAPLGLSAQLDIKRNPTTTPESVRELENSVAGGIDPWYNLPGRAAKALKTKDKMVSDLLDPEGERCPNQCSMHGQCIMDMTSTVKSPSGAQNVHPFHCLCDSGYVGDACQIQLDMHLRWLLTEGAAPFPKCCTVCAKQMDVPDSWDDIPTYTNPFAEFAPECQPFPRVSLYSREDGTHELIKGRRPDPKCSSPLGEIAREKPLVALELATDLSAAQGVLSGGLLESMSLLSSSAEHRSALSTQERAQHAQRLRAGAATVKQASRSARKAAQALALKLHLTDLATTKYSSIDLDQLLSDYRELPNDMPECCLFCQLEKDPEPFISNQDPAANVGPNAILNQDPRADSAIDAAHRRMALKRQDKRHAKLTGTVPQAEADCCVVCPYNFREIERLKEAAFVRKHKSSLDEEMDKVFLETFAEIDGDRRRRHQPRPCCPACPSQFLIAHAFPAGPWTTTRTMPNTGPA